MTDSLTHLMHDLADGAAAHPRLLVLVVVLAVAVAHDLSSRRIPNTLVLAAAAVALLDAALRPTAGPGLNAALGGLATGLLLPMPLYALRAMGAGDVKLLAAIGAFLGTLGALHAVVATLLAGGVVALVQAGRSGRLRRMAGNVRAIALDAATAAATGRAPSSATAFDTAGRVPYAVAIALGTVATLALGHLPDR